MSEEANILFIFKNVKHTSLQSAIEALKARLATYENISYTQAANTISTAVSGMPEFLYNIWNISTVNFSNKTKPTGSSGIYNADSKIITSHINYWQSLTPTDRALVHYERTKLGISKRKDSSDKGTLKYSNIKNKLKQLTEQNKNFKWQIESFKRSLTYGLYEVESYGDITDTGDQFSGKTAKKKQKKLLAVLNEINNYYKANPIQISRLTSSLRSIKSASTSHSKRPKTIYSKCRLDSHAETTIAGENCFILH